MSSQLSWHGDEAHRRWLRDSFDRAADEAGAAILIGEPLFGWRERSVGCRIQTSEGERWLRVVCEQLQWAEGDFWAGNVEANTIDGVAKPKVLRHWEWNEGSSRLRAELMTSVPGRRCSTTPELREPLELPPSWWAELHVSLEALAETHTERVHVRQADVTRRLRVFFGDRIADPTVSRWVPAHTDLHWANLLAPDCALVDWEGWGIAPMGFDIASLYLHSLLEPEMSQRLRLEFGRRLSERDGMLAQLHVTGRMLLRINSGDYEDLAIPLHRNAEAVIGATTALR